MYKQILDELYFGSTNVYFDIVDGESFSFQTDSFIESTDSKSFEDARARMKPLTNLGISIQFA